MGLTEEFEAKCSELKREHKERIREHKERIQDLIQELAEKYRTVQNGTRFHYQGQECEVVGVTFYVPEEECSISPLRLLCLVSHPEFSGYYSNSGYPTDRKTGIWKDVVLPEAAIIAYLEREKESRQSSDFSRYGT